MADRSSGVSWHIRSDGADDEIWFCEEKNHIQLISRLILCSPCDAPADVNQSLPAYESLKTSIYMVQAGFQDYFPLYDMKATTKSLLSNVPAISDLVKVSATAPCWSLESGTKWKLSSLCLWITDFRQRFHQGRHLPSGAAS